VITSHYVDNNFRVQEDLLDFAHILISHTGENLAEHVFKVLSDYNIHTHLFCVTSNNASNNGKMVERLTIILREHGVTWDGPSHHITCLAYVLNLAVKKFLSTLKIGALTTEDEWISKGNGITDSNESSSHRRYQIKGDNEFDHVMQKIHKLSNLINYTLSHLQDFELFCKAVKVTFM